MPDGSLCEEGILSYSGATRCAGWRQLSRTGAELVGGTDGQVAVNGWVCPQVHVLRGMNAYDDAWCFPGTHQSDGYHACTLVQKYVHMPTARLLQCAADCDVSRAALGWRANLLRPGRGTSASACVLQVPPQLILHHSFSGTLRRGLSQWRLKSMMAGKAWIGRCVRLLPHLRAECRYLRFFKVDIIDIRLATRCSPSASVERHLGTAAIATRCKLQDVTTG